MQAAHVSQFLTDLPAGLDTQLGERGFGLSGGQIQRIALARAFLKPAPIVLLDEPTAALDQETEQELIAVIQNLAQERLCLIASHSPAVIKSADQVIKLKQSSSANEGAVI